MNINLVETYKERTSNFNIVVAHLEKKYQRYTWVRLIAFIAGVALIILVGSFHFLLGIGATILFLLGFYRFVHWHQQIKDAENHNRVLGQLNQDELARLNHELDSFEDGKAFIDVLHPYIVDLDIFGPFSIFQYFNRTGTLVGKQRLAQYLSNPAAKSEILLRQDAIKELTPQIDWRQHFQAFGVNAEDKVEHLKAIEIWRTSENFVLNSSIYKLSLYLIPLWSIIFLITIAPIYPWFITLCCLIPAGLILRQTLSKVNQAHIQTAEIGKILKIYSNLIQWVEDAEFNSEKLKADQSSFFAGGKRASNKLKQLAYRIEQLNVRFNPFAILLNFFFLWDLHWMFRLEKWKVENKELLPRWFDALPEFEAISSIATTHYNNPDWYFPEIISQPILDAQSIGHPLIHSSSRVSNDFKMPFEGHLKLVTGSNMAGKSTFLRSVGVNMVLAMSGSPVCAKRFQVPLVQVYTSMRTQDALQESTSSFYAELKRLKFIIEAIENQVDRPYYPYFLLDEILKGTNSNDRHIGGKALIKQLIRAKGAGIIATHDLELGVLEEQYGGAIENLCMEVEIIDSQLHFDYKLKKGVSNSFNATILMQEMGIAIDEQ